MEGKITYHQQVSYCGKPQCRKCQEGIGHGPYWYAYKTTSGRTSRTYIGKKLPAEIQASLKVSALADASAQFPPSTDLGAVALRVFTLGRFQLERLVGQQWQLVTDAAWLQHAHVRALFALLLCSTGRRVSRSAALRTLWPEDDTATARKNLHAALLSLRKILRDPRTSGSQDVLLHSEGDYLLLADQQDIWIDAEDFEALLTQAAVTSSTSTHASLPADLLASLRENAASSRVDTNRIRILQEALALYAGDFLPENQHMLQVREHAQKLRHLWIVALLTFADLQAPTEASAAIETLNRLLAHDPTNELAVQRLITILMRLKRRGEALQAYNHLADVLKHEHATPALETQNLYGAIIQSQDNIIIPTTEKMTKAANFLVTTQMFAQEIPVPMDDLQMLLIGRGNQTPLVGREREIDVLHQLLHAVKIDKWQQERRTTGIPLDTQRSPQCVVLMGESGLGKTRLAEEISREAQHDNWAVLWGRMYPQESGVPYRLWSEALNKVLDAEADLLPHFYERLHSTSPLTIGNGLASSAETLRPLVTLLPRLREHFPAPTQELGGQFTPAQEQRRLWEAIHDFFALVCEHIPLLIVLDDIQWADASSCELLGYLARSLYGFPIAFIVTCRDTDLPTPHPLRSLIDHMLREHAIMTLTIEPLSSEQIGRLVTGMSELSSPMVQYIQEHAAGNPLFAEEIARTSPPELPQTVSAAMNHRMSLLSDDCQRLLSNAAVIGGSFEFPLICALGGDSSVVDEDTTLDLLEEALLSGVLTEEGTGARVTYHFWHPLLVTYLYENISALRRALLHKRVADILQQSRKGHEEEVAATITHHLTRSDAEPGLIAHFAEMAGDHAYGLSANAEAVQHYWLAVEQLGLVRRQDAEEQLSFSSSSEVSLASTQDLLHHVHLLERLAECVMIRGDFTQARYLFERILSLHQGLVVTDQQYEAQVQAMLWNEVGRTWRYAAHSTQAWACCERAEQLLHAAAVADGPVWVRLHLLQCSLYEQDGAYEEAQRVARNALEFLKQQQHLAHEDSGWMPNEHMTRIERILQGEPVDLGYVHRTLGDLAHRVGQLSTSLHHLNLALSLYEQYGYKREIAHVSCNLAYIHLKMADYEQAQAIFRRAFSLAESMDDDPLLSVIYSDQGEMAAAQGELQDAEYWYRKALALLERTEDREYLSLWNAALAPILQALGKYEEAAACAVLALRIGRSTHKNPCIGVALVVLGTIRMMQAQNLSLLSYGRIRRLSHAQQDVQRALALNGLDAETRAKGRLVLAHIALLAGEYERAHHELSLLIEHVRFQGFALIEQQAVTLLES
ncbi:MAG TPA: DUF6788 family protein [Ktedonobacteraceae bacterium]|nr:DUF6788 family protein [Ktedonobacteraceae bacterium]